MPKGKKRLKDCLGEKLRKQFAYVATNAEATCQEFQRGDNKQGRDHCGAVEKNLDLLIPDAKKESGLNETEIFVLLAAAHLHDIGKVEGAGKSGWKSEHGHRGQELINEHYDKLGLDRVQAAAVGHVVGVHGDGRLDQLPQKPMLIGTDEVHLIELAAVFRLADMLDTTFQRAPELVARILFPDGNVPDKWLARQAISGWTLDERNRIVLQAIPATDEVSFAYALKDMLNEDLSKIVPHLRLAGYPWELAELDIGDVRLAPSLRQQAYQDRPFPGMAYYEEDQAGIFKGREVEIEKLVSVVSNSPISLLIGESGAGKTSLIHAGLFPRLKAMMWVCVWARPLGNPRSTIRDLIWRATLEGPIKSESSLWEVMRSAAEKCRPRNLLIVLDQFEDILSSPQSVLDEFANDLVTVQARSVMPNLRVLVSFREDSLVRLSTRLLKAITGSAQQFPSIELERLTRDGARQALHSGFENAHIGLDPRQDIGQKPLIEIILDDIQLSDDRLYPPYLQMVAETLCKLVEKDNPIISRENYQQIGGATNIIAHYLINRLDEFGHQKEDARKVLIYLTSSSGKKTQKTISALSQATGITAAPLKDILTMMIDLRIARTIDRDEYEIVHDHLGRLVDEELVGKEDREIKFLQEQLDAAQRLYEVHREPIRSSTVWASLYRNRKKIVIDQDKQSLIVCSYFSNVVTVKIRSRSEKSFNRIRTKISTMRCGWVWLQSIPRASLVVLAAGLINHGESQISKSAINFMFSLVTRDDLSLIMGMLNDEDWKVRRTAVKVFAKLGTRDDLRYIMGMLNDEDRTVRQAAVNVINNLGTRDDLSHILGMLRDDDVFIRLAVLEALLKHGTRDDLSLIFGMLKDADKNVRRTAVVVFSKHGTHDDLSHILGMLNDESRTVRQAVMEAFSNLGTHDDLSHILSMLKDADEDVRQAAVEVFSQLGTHGDLSYILTMLKDEEDDVSQAAVEVFSKLGTHDDLSHILGMLKDKNWEIRKMAVNVFTKLGTHDDLSHILGMLKDVDEDVRQAAVKAFSKLGTHDDLNHILDMLKDADEDVRQAAVEVFSKLGTHDDLSHILGMFKDVDEDVRQAAVEAFSKLGTHDDLSSIFGMLKDENWEIRRMSVSVFARLGTHDDLSHILGMLKDKSRKVRLAAVDALSKLGTRAELSHILEMLMDDDDDVRQAAMEVLIQIATNDDAEGLMDIVAERSLGWHAIASTHYQALCLLDKKFYSPNSPEEQRTFL